MIADTVLKEFTRCFELELVPPTRWDAAQAVLYRVGEPLDLTGRNEWSAACREALTERLLPRQRTRRKRWISAVLREDGTCLAQPPHERPALLSAARLSIFLPGGLLIEKLSDLGEDPVHRAAIITWLAEHAGMPGVRGVDHVVPEIARNPMGTVTVGELEPRRDGRRGRTARTDRPVQEHVRKLNAAALSAVEAAAGRARYVELYHLFDEAVWNAASLPELKIDFAGHVLSSQLFADLTVDAARDVAQRMRTENVHPDRAWEALQLAGFINESGHRCWYRELVDRAGGWRN